MTPALKSLPLSFLLVGLANVQVVTADTEQSKETTTEEAAKRFEKFVKKTNAQVSGWDFEEWLLDVPERNPSLYGSTSTVSTGDDLRVVTRDLWSGKKNPVDEDPYDPNTGEGDKFPGNGNGRGGGNFDNDDDCRFHATKKKTFCTPMKRPKDMTDPGDGDDDDGDEDDGKGNNGLGNGLDPQPPGDPKPNDEPTAVPGEPNVRGL